MRHRHKKTKRRNKRKQKGGFTPSIMGSFVQNASMLTPLAIAAGYRLVNSKTRKQKRR